MTTDALVNTLTAIGNKPGTTRRDLLTITRRLVRHFSELRHSDPFTQRRADALGRQASEHRAEELASVDDVLEDYGRVLVLDHEGYARGLGFDALADLLNINRVDRERARREGRCTLAELVAIEDLENSAEGRGDGWEDGNPLQQACLLAMGGMLSCPPDQMPEPRTVGRTRKRPALVVHDRHGSRVEER